MEEYLYLQLKKEFEKLKVDSDTKQGRNENTDKNAEESIPPFCIKIPPSLSVYHCHFNWVKDETFTEEEAKTIQSVYASKFGAKGLDTEGSFLKYNGIKIIADRASQAFCNIFLNNYEDGKSQISDTERLINESKRANYFPKEYAEGLQYVLRGLRLYYLSVQIEKHIDEDANIEKFERLISRCVPFESLSLKGKIAVKIVDIHFSGQRRGKDAERVQIFKDIIRQDENYYVWYFELYTLLRIMRRQTRFEPGPRVGPSDEEKAMILKTAELMDPVNPFVFIDLCQCLVETFIATHGFEREPWENPICMGQFGTFTTALEVQLFARKMSNKALELYGESTRVNVSLAEIFSTVFPHKYRDYGFAKECIQRALDDNPHCSKANHRMGVICLTADSYPEMDEAIKYFKRSIVADPRNFPALLDMIKTMMGDLRKFAQELETLFQEHLRNFMWKNDKLGDLYMLFGMFNFMKNDTNAAVDNWILCNSEDPESLKRVLKSVSYNCKRYKWKRHEISIYRIRSQLDAMSMDIARSQEQKATIREIIALVDGIILDDNLRKARVVGSDPGQGIQRNHGSSGGSWRQNNTTRSEIQDSRDDRGQSSSDDSRWGPGSRDNRWGSDSRDNRLGGGSGSTYNRWNSSGNYNRWGPSGSGDRWAANGNENSWGSGRSDNIWRRGNSGNRFGR